MVGDKPWGSHFFLFYEKKVDLLDASVPYFKTGLENNEFCAWVVAEPLTEEEARDALSQAIPHFRRHLTEGNIEILPGRDFYLNGDQLVLERASQGWSDKLDRALHSGYDGMRGSGTSSWLERKHQFAKARRNGSWEVVETSQLKEAKAARGEAGTCAVDESCAERARKPPANTRAK